MSQVGPVPLRPAQLDFPECFLRGGVPLHQPQHDGFRQRQVRILRICLDRLFQQIQTIRFSVKVQEQQDSLLHHAGAGGGLTEPLIEHFFRLGLPPRGIEKGGFEEQSISGHFRRRNLFQKLESRLRSVRGEEGGRQIQTCRGSFRCRALQEFPRRGKDLAPQPDRRQ